MPSVLFKNSSIQKIPWNLVANLLKNTLEKFSTKVEEAEANQRGSEKHVRCFKLNCLSRATSWPQKTSLRLGTGRVFLCLNRTSRVYQPKLRSLIYNI